METLNPTAKTFPEVVAEVMRECKTTYSARFIPASKSSDNEKDANIRIHWEVEIGGKFFSFFTGCGHLPLKPEDKKRTLYVDELIKTACETGKLYGKRIPIPAPEDVLYCILLDSEADNMEFEEWAREFGYSDDLISAKKIYDKCRVNGMKLRRIFPSDKLEILREASRDY